MHAFPIHAEDSGPLIEPHTDLNFELREPRPALWASPVVGPSTTATLGIAVEVPVGADTCARKGHLFDLFLGLFDLAVDLVLFLELFGLVLGADARVDPVDESARHPPGQELVDDGGDGEEAVQDRGECE